MIARSELSRIGAFLKPHGVKGELNAVVDGGGDVLDRLRCIFVEIEGLMVPFFIAGHRSRGSQAELISLDDVDSEPKARQFAGKDIYALREEAAAGDDDADTDAGEGFYLDDLEGFAVVADGEPIGRVAGFDDSTANVLMFVDDADGRRRILPVADEFFDSVDPETKTIYLTLPEGILDL